MELIESGILGRQEDWQRIAEMIQSMPEGNWVKQLEKLARHVDGKRGGGTRMSRRS